MNVVRGFHYVVCVAVLAVGLTSCRGDDNETPAPATTSTPAPTTPAPPSPVALTSVPKANLATAGLDSRSALSPELTQVVVAQGAIAMENAVTNFLFYGTSGDGPLVPAPGDVQTTTHNIESTKTEPDKNTYLVLTGQTGPTANLNYGTHFLFQGHELGVRNPATGNQRGSITRINLDADEAHRITLMASTDVNGNPLPTFDGSTWNPFAQRLLFTAELGNQGGVWQATADFPARAEDLGGIMGRGGYEGIQNDSDGNLWIVEDVGGPNGTTNAQARQPNSFIYRFVPKDRTNLIQGGRLQALQVTSLANAGQLIVFHAGQVDADILSRDVGDLHTYGNVFQTRWVTIHDTATDGTAAFDANARAKATNATPFKRPENGVFRPGTSFMEFFFTETGDTNANTQAGTNFGGFGGLFKLTQANGPSADTGTLRLFYRGDGDHAGFDNLAFLTKDQLLVVEDRGDTLHRQRNALDSGFVFDANADYGNNSTSAPIRFLAQGRDASATFDSQVLAAGGNGFQNDGDNEITGIHVSDGDSTTGGILGAKLPDPFKNGWRVFYTQQHGDNVTYEILKQP